MKSILEKIKCLTLDLWKLKLKILKLTREILQNVFGKIRCRNVMLCYATSPTERLWKYW